MGMRDPESTDSLPQETLDRISSLAISTGPKQACLLVLAGPNKGAVLRLCPGINLLGRAAGQVHIVVTGNGVSRIHARVELFPSGEIGLYDMNSTNGCFVNGYRVEAASLSDGDTIRLGGEAVLKLEFRDPAVQELIHDLYLGATTDTLTALTNRRAFLERVTQEIAASRRHRIPNCVAMLDIDYFKTVNDSYGHPAGDAVLRGVARVLKEGVRTEDLVARYGGEEFAILIRQAPVKGAVIMLERLRRAVAATRINAPTPEGVVPLSVTISIGVANLNSAHSAEAAVGMADVALYNAKNEGRDRVCILDDEETITDPHSK